jgi:hypothetical protein
LPPKSLVAETLGRNAATDSRSLPNAGGKKPASRDKRLDHPVAFAEAIHVVDLDDTQGMNVGHAK